MNIYTVRDTKSGLYSAPFFQLNDEMAIRAWFGAVINKETLFAQHPGDFDLYRIGKWDEESAVIESTSPVHVRSAASILAEWQEREAIRDEALPLTRSGS